MVGDLQVCTVWGWDVGAGDGEHAEVLWGAEAGDEGSAGVGCAGDEVLPVWGRGGDGGER